MAKIENFEEILAWQKSMLLCDAIYAITLKESFSKDFALKDQIRKSAISVPSNISEGFEREGNNQFIYFFEDSKGFSRRIKNTTNDSKKSKLYYQ